MACEHYDFPHDHDTLRERLRYAYDRGAWFVTKWGVIGYALHAIVHPIAERLFGVCF